MGVRRSRFGTDRKEQESPKGNEDGTRTAATGPQRL
jgi:hypothetical protein